MIFTETKLAGAFTIDVERRGDFVDFSVGCFVSVSSTTAD